MVISLDGSMGVPIIYSVFNVMVLSISPPAQMLLLNMLFLSFTEFVNYSYLYNSKWNQTGINLF